VFLIVKIPAGGACVDAEQGPERLGHQVADQDDSPILVTKEIKRIHVEKKTSWVVKHEFDEDTI
jgi:hypothetical protein